MGAISRKFANNFTTGGVFTSSAIVNASLNNVTDIPSAAKGKLILLSTATASSSASLEFNSTYINSSYSIYKFEFINIHPSNNDVEFQFNLSTDNGSNYNVTKTSTFFYAFHNESDSATTLSYDGGSDLAQGTGFQNLSLGQGNENDETCDGQLQLFNPSSTTFVKHFISRIAFYQHNNYAFDTYIAGYGNTTSAVNAVQFKFSAGNIDAGAIRLYGIA